MIEIRKDIILNNIRFKYYPDSRGVTMRDFWEATEKTKGYSKLHIGWKNNNLKIFGGTNEERLKYKQALTEFNKQIKKGETI